MHLAEIFNVDGCGVVGASGVWDTDAWDILDRSFTNHTECLLKNGMGGGGTFKLVSGMLYYA